MKKVDLNETAAFDDKSIKKFLVHDSPYFRIINFNIGAGQTFPVHSHDDEGQLTIQVISGKGFFLGAEDAAMPARQGEVLVSDISEPHGVRAETDMRILVTIAPPI